MNFTLHQLQVFQKVVEKESITKAAEELHLTQPAVSIQLKKFQEQFDIPLMEVVGRKLYITGFGKEMAHSAAEILEGARQIEQKMFAHKGQLSGTLKISVVSTGKYVMPYFLAGFLQMHPAVELELHVTNKSQVLSHLEKNEIDFALVSLLPEKLQVEKMEMMDNHLYLVGGVQRKFPHQASLPEILKDSPFIFREQGSATRLLSEKFFLSRGIPVEKKMELTSNEAVKQAVIAGLGCSIMPIIGIRNEIILGELQIISNPSFPLTTTWNLVWPKQKKHGVISSALLTYLEARKDEIIKEKFSWMQDMV